MFSLVFLIPSVPFHLSYSLLLLPVPTFTLVTPVNNFMFTVTHPLSRDNKWRVTRVLRSSGNGRSFETILSPTSFVKIVTPPHTLFSLSFPQVSYKKLKCKIESRSEYPFTPYHTFSYYTVLFHPFPSFHFLSFYRLSSSFLSSSFSSYSYRGSLVWYGQVFHDEPGDDPLSR